MTGPDKTCSICGHMACQGAHFRPRTIWPGLVGDHAPVCTICRPIVDCHNPIILGVHRRIPQSVGNMSQEELLGVIADVVGFIVDEAAQMICLRRRDAISADDMGEHETTGD